MTSDSSSCTFSIGMSFGGSALCPPSHRPDVSGCVGLASRAQANVLRQQLQRQRAACSGRLSFESLSCRSCCRSCCRARSRCPRPGRASSLEMADDALRRMLPAACAGRGSCRSAAPGLCTQPELCRPCCGSRCLPSLRVRVPHAVEQHEHHADACACRRRPGTGPSARGSPGLSCSQSRWCRKTRMLLKPRLLGPAQLAVDGGGVEGVGLPHFELVDGVGRRVIAADEPRRLLSPRLRLRAGQRAASSAATGAALPSPARHAAIHAQADSLFMRCFPFRVVPEPFRLNIPQRYGTMLR